MPACEPQSRRARLPDKNFPFLEQYGFDRRDADSQKGKVNLGDLSFDITTVERAVLWRKVLNAMNAGEMPPKKRPQPADDEKADNLAAKEVIPVHASVIERLKAYLPKTNLPQRN